MDSDPVPQFRPSKRQKLIRSKRVDFNGDHSEPQNTKSPPLSGSESDEPTVSAAARFRRPAPRKFGIASSKPATTFQMQSSIEQESKLTVSVDEVAIRFTPQTGLVKDDTDKHMNAYVDARLAQMQGDDADNDDDSSTSNIERSSLSTSRQAAGLGKLQEIDLGPDATRMNMLRTQEATARMNGDPQPEADTAPKHKGKPRFGRDGKPWRSRRKRRTSDDVKRDKMVEAILAESRLELYENPSSAVEEREDDEGADDRLAEEFRRNYMDAQQAKRKQPPTNRQQVKKDLLDKSKVKGPKLGGSRSARAAMYKSMQDSSKGIN